MAFIEAMLCENNPDNAERIQKMYDDAKPRPPMARGDDRRADVLRFMAIAG